MLWLAVLGPSNGQSDCLSVLPLLGERTWLQGGSWFEMVPALTPGGHRASGMACLSLFLRIAELAEQKVTLSSPLYTSSSLDFL